MSNTQRNIGRPNFGTVSALRFLAGRAHDRLPELNASLHPLFSHHEEPSRPNPLPASPFEPYLNQYVVMEEIGKGMQGRLRRCVDATYNV
jgi:hypothetical protein